MVLREQQFHLCSFCSYTSEILAKRIAANNSCANQTGLLFTGDRVRPLGTVSSSKNPAKRPSLIDPMWEVQMNLNAALSELNRNTAKVR